MSTRSPTAEWSKAGVALAARRRSRAERTGGRTKRRRQQWRNFVKEDLGVPGYVRYVDDFVLFAPDKASLQRWKKQIAAWLCRVRMVLHPEKMQVHRVGEGLPFLGFRIFPYFRYVNKANAHRAERFVRKKLQMYRLRRFSPDQLEAGLNSWLGHVRFGWSRRLEKRVYSAVWEWGVLVLPHPQGSWRVLDHTAALKIQA